MISMFSMARGMLSHLKTQPLHPPNDESIDDSMVLSVSWNQDWTGFAIGTSQGFRVYTCNPFKETINRDFNQSGFQIVEMLFLTNIFALVGNDSQYPNHKVFIWDDHKNGCFCELNFRSKVIAVKLRKEFIFIVLKQSIYVYTFHDLKVFRLIETLTNLKGLCCVSQNESKSLVACPGFHPGQIQVHDLKRKMIKFIKAHDSEIACMSLSLDGNLLATASIKGTLIRIFNPLDGSLLQELRRGMERAEIYSVAISSNVKWIAVSSDRGTLHLFYLKVDGLNKPTRGMLPKYFYDERSFAQFSLPVSTKFMVGFGLDNSVLLLGGDGRLRRCRFDPERGGEMVEVDDSEHIYEYEII